LSPDGKKLVSGSEDGAVRLWNIDTGNVIAKWTGHTGYVNSMCWNQDDGRVVSGSGVDGTARVWDVESGKTVLEIKTSPSDYWIGAAIYSAAIYSPDASIIATSNYDENKKEFIKIWNANTGKLVTNLKGHTEKVTCLAWTADGGRLISGSFDYSIRTWDTSTWRQIAVLTEHTSYVVGIAISPNGRILASASWDKTAQLWNLENGQSIGEPLQHESYVNCVSFSTDGKLLATGCSDENAYTWDISVIAREAGLELVLNPNVS
jgi:WD40 repeat protein